MYRIRTRKKRKERSLSEGKVNSQDLDHGGLQIILGCNMRLVACYTILCSPTTVRGALFAESVITRVSAIVGLGDVTGVVDCPNAYRVSDSIFCISTINTVTNGEACTDMDIDNVPIIITATRGCTSIIKWSGICHGPTKRGTRRQTL